MEKLDGILILNGRRLISSLSIVLCTLCSCIGQNQSWGLQMDNYSFDTPNENIYFDLDYDWDSWSTSNQINIQFLHQFNIDSQFVLSSTIGWGGYIGKLIRFGSRTVDERIYRSYRVNCLSFGTDVKRYFRRTNDGLYISSGLKYYRIFRQTQTTDILEGDYLVSSIYEKYENLLNLNPIELNLGLGYTCNLPFKESLNFKLNLGLGISYITNGRYNAATNNFNHGFSIGLLISRK